MSFINQDNCAVLPASRHSATLRLRRLERKVLIWKAIWSAITGMLRVELGVSESWRFQISAVCPINNS